MIVLALGVVLVSALHLIPALPEIKATVIARVGQRAYGPVFAMTSVVALAFIIVGWRMAEIVPVYEPAAWGRHVNFGLTLVGFVCLGIFLFRGSLRQRLRFPMGIAVLFWATGHLLANGDFRSLILFGGLLIYAILHMTIGMLQGVRPTPEIRSGHDFLAVMTGVALYGAMTQLHPILIGVPILSLPQ